MLWVDSETQAGVKITKTILSVSSVWMFQTSGVPFVNPALQSLASYSHFRPFRRLSQTKLEHWNIETLEHWTLEHLTIWNIGSLELWNIESFEYLVSIDHLCDPPDSPDSPDSPESPDPGDQLQDEHSFLRSITDGCKSQLWKGNTCKE